MTDRRGRQLVVVHNEAWSGGIRTGLRTGGSASRDCLQPWKTRRVGKPSRNSWITTTHEWPSDVDIDHLSDARRLVGDVGPVEVVHMILEVLAYADDEAEARQRIGTAVVHVRGTEIAVSDDGRGTDTRQDADGAVVRKPVMATRDVRFYGSDSAPCLPDGMRRRGMSTVAAACSELVHENRRSEGAWYQTYRYGIPDNELTPLNLDSGTGTTVRLRGISEPLLASMDLHALRELTTQFRHITVAIVHENRSFTIITQPLLANPYCFIFPCDCSDFTFACAFVVVLAIEVRVLAYSDRFMLD